MSTERVKSARTISLAAIGILLFSLFLLEESKKLSATLDNVYPKLMAYLLLNGGINNSKRHVDEDNSEAYTGGFNDAWINHGGFSIFGLKNFGDKTTYGIQLKYLHDYLIELIYTTGAHSASIIDFAKQASSKPDQDDVDPCEIISAIPVRVLGNSFSKEPIEFVLQDGYFDSLDGQGALTIVPEDVATFFTLDGTPSASFTKERLESWILSQTRSIGILEKHPVDAFLILDNAYKLKQVKLPILGVTTNINYASLLLLCLSTSLVVFLSSNMRYLSHTDLSSNNEPWLLHDWKRYSRLDPICKIISYIEAIVGVLGYLVAILSPIAVAYLTFTLGNMYDMEAPAWFTWYAVVGLSILPIYSSIQSIYLLLRH